jgi:response regulator RpfG family c-di-GMP phosphodiesterase
VHLLLSDVVMPGMTGPQLVAKALAQRPSLKVLYVTGYSDSTILSHGIIETGLVLLKKPITPDLLLRKVRTVLGAPTA